MSLMTGRVQLSALCVSYMYNVSNSVFLENVTVLSELV